MWAAGVLLWEILSDGQTQPYDKYSSGQIIQYLNRGGRLTCPTGHSRIVQMFYSTVTKACWNSIEKSRLSAYELYDVVNNHPRELQNRPEMLPRLSPSPDQPDVQEREFLVPPISPTRKLIHPKKKGFLKRFKWKGSSKG